MSSLSGAINGKGTTVVGLDEAIRKLQKMEKTLITRGERSKVFTKGRKPLVALAKTQVFDSGVTRGYKGKYTIHSGNLRASIKKIPLRSRDISSVGPVRVRNLDEVLKKKKKNQTSLGWRKGTASGYYGHIANYDMYKGTPRKVHRNKDFMTRIYDLGKHPSREAMIAELFRIFRQYQV